MRDVVAAFRFGLLGLAAFATLGVAGTTNARQIIDRENPFANLVSRPAAARAAALPLGQSPKLLVAGEGRARLVFDAKGAVARARFHCSGGDTAVGCLGATGGWSDEILTLYGAPGAKADMVYATRDRAVRLRISPRGQTTLYSAGGAPSGEPVFLAKGPAAQAIALGAPLAPRAAGPLEVAQDARIAGTRISQRLGSVFVFDIGEPADGVDHSVLGDAVNVTAAGIYSVASDPIGRRSLSGRLSRVRFERGELPDLSLEGDALIVAYNPQKDVSGRPSSSRVRAFLESHL